MTLFTRTRIAMGEGYLDRYTIFECKFLFSIYFHVFNTVKQDRFHTHAFNGLVVLLKGGYYEEVEIHPGVFITKWIGPGIRYIPRDYKHRLLRSLTNTWSLLLAGPWNSTWIEESDDYVRTLSWGRKEVTRQEKQHV